MKLKGVLWGDTSTTNFKWLTFNLNLVKNCEGATLLSPSFNVTKVTYRAADVPQYIQYTRPTTNDPWCVSYYDIDVMNDTISVAYPSSYVTFTDPTRFDLAVVADKPGFYFD